jgi:hypothetical protein
LNRAAVSNVFATGPMQAQHQAGTNWQPFRPRAAKICGLEIGSGGRRQVEAEYSSGTKPAARQKQLKSCFSNLRFRLLARIRQACVLFRRPKLHPQGQLPELMSTTPPRRRLDGRIAGRQTGSRAVSPDPHIGQSGRSSLVSTSALNSCRQDRHANP